uniref:Sulfur oxidation protein SoxZ n=1 Tax=uncultured Thiotrichaceae bacterium TaxID=298394 RepID=A0A6S6UB00_9GAMM|nr:MAG: Sulfur oxidation protein SoxZ [uncultured Thiotrichaceae bacterium]
MAKSSIKLKAKEKDGVLQIKALMNHPMETGQRKDKDGKKIPAHYISELVIQVNDKDAMSANWGASISKNPFLSVAIAGKKGDTVKLSWTDNKEESDSAEAKAK